MKTTGIFSTHRYLIKCRVGRPIKVIPFGDIHRHAPLCDVAKWHSFLDQCRADKEDTYYLGMGDYDDLASASEREVLSSSKLHDSTRRTLEDFASDKGKALAKELAFMRGRVIGLIGGNHYFQFESGINSDQRLAEALQTRFLGVSSFIRVVLDDGHNHSAAVDIWAHHGKGAARLIGGSLNRVAQMRECAEADIYIMGHDHRRGAVPSGSKLHLTDHGGSLGLRYKKQWLVRSGSFLRGYVDGERSYIADAAMNPTDLGAVRLELTLKRNATRTPDEHITVDVHCWS